MSSGEGPPSSSDTSETLGGGEMRKRQIKYTSTIPPFLSVRNLLAAVLGSRSSDTYDGVDALLLIFEG
jgi:hypothetical protein